ncbi:hypothetical protein ACPA9J_19050 [Pseudomonas aeruginosa]
MNPSLARSSLHRPPHPHIAIYRNRQHEIVGYCAVHFHDSEVFQYSKACVIRAEDRGILPEYRGEQPEHSLPYPPGAALQVAQPRQAPAVPRHPDPSLQLRPGDQVRG